MEKGSDYNQDINLIAKCADSLSYGELIYSDTYESNKNYPHFRIP
jgi:hypothetical protein